MAKEFEIIDLFAGPGGLGEGFSAAGRETSTKMKIRLSVEMDFEAVETLQLRAFLRSFEGGFPQEYYDALNTQSEFPDWSELYPDNWEEAINEAQQFTLGEPGTFEEIAEILDDSRERTGGNTILIGGPPCQAYSLVGRSRNQGNKSYDPKEDKRNYLYREYVKILGRLKPAAFVMENVKGILSSRVDGEKVFDLILEDLKNAGDGYDLLPLTAAEKPEEGSLSARDFLVFSEEHGVPQARHRVFVVGIRKDIAKRKEIEFPLLPIEEKRVSVEKAISDLPKLRSGLSKGDGVTDWQDAVRRQALKISKSSEVPTAVRGIARSIAGNKNLPKGRKSTKKGKQNKIPSHLQAWLIDSNLNSIVHHETRGHIEGDLGRYMFSAAYAEGVEPRSPVLREFPEFLQPNHKNKKTGAFADRFRVQVRSKPSTTVTSHISKDGHYFIHYDSAQCRSLTVREAARLQTFPDNYFFSGARTKQYHQVGNAVPPYLAYQIAKVVRELVAGER